MRAVVGGGIFVISLNLAGAQSSSPSYQAVDFLNPEASLSSSGSYMLDDSVDYYGGIHTSANYTECTGDFAVLSGCTPPVVPPPPPPPPPPGGGGSGPTDICEYGGCDIPPVEEPPAEEIPEKKPFKLPDIKEPVAVVVEPDKVPEAEPPVEVPVPEVLQTEPVVETVRKATYIMGSELLRKVAPEYCYDLTCSSVNLFRPAAQEGRAGIGTSCPIYVFGSFIFHITCFERAMIWVVVGLVVIIFFQIGFPDVRRKLLRSGKRKW